MKVRAITRSSEAFQPPGSNIQNLPRNHDPAVHPFERAREYTRALTATKVERMFAQPFVGELPRGHIDGVYSMGKDPSSLERFASGSGDGVVKVWDLSTREEIWNAKPHANIVDGMCWTSDKKLLTCGSRDKTIALHDPYDTPSKSEPLRIWQLKIPVTSVSSHRDESVFATSTATGISVFDLNRQSTHPTNSMTWQGSVDTVKTVSFNKVETSILASTATDRSVVLYDLRTSSPIAKQVLSLPANKVAWNPMEGMNFVTASEDHNLYMFDGRNLKRALNVFKGHVAAVMDCEWSPTGQELVSGSYDRTVRLWSRSSGTSRDTYHSKRMQRIFSCSWSADNNYVLSGSDDGNIRIWRAVASKRQGTISARQRQSLEYSEALKKRYAHMPEIRRIARHRHMPKAVKKAGDIKREELGALKKRQENRRKHEKKTAGKEPRKSEREKMVLATEQ